MSNVLSEKCFNFKKLIVSSCDLPLNHGTTCPLGKPLNLSFFDIESETCQNFEYKGCGGNENKFLSERYWTYYFI